MRNERLFTQVGKTRHTRYKIDSSWLSSMIYKKDLGVVVNHRLNMSQQRAAVGRRANVVLACIKRGIISRGIIILLYLALVRLPEILC